MMAVAARINLPTTVLFTLVASVLVVLAVISLTPAQIGPVGVTAWFVGFFTAVGGGLALLLHAAKRLILSQSPNLKFQASLRQGFLISAWASVNLALSSLRQLSLRDVLLSGLLVVMVEFYLRLK